MWENVLEPDWTHLTI